MSKTPSACLLRVQARGGKRTNGRIWLLPSIEAGYIVRLALWKVVEARDPMILCPRGTTSMFNHRPYPRRPSASGFFLLAAVSRFAVYAASLFPRASRQDIARVSTAVAGR